MTPVRSIRPAILLCFALWSAGLVSAQVDPHAETLLNEMAESFSQTPQLEAYESLDTMDLTFCFTFYEAGETQPEMCTRMVMDRTNRRMMQEMHMTFEQEEHVTKTVYKGRSAHDK